MLHSAKPYGQTQQNNGAANDILTSIKVCLVRRYSASCTQQDSIVFYSFTSNCPISNWNHYGLLYQVGGNCWGKGEKGLRPPSCLQPPTWTYLSWRFRLLSDPTHCTYLSITGVVCHCAICTDFFHMQHHLLPVLVNIPLKNDFCMYRFKHFNI